jgi:hypothetical protein
VNLIEPRRKSLDDCFQAMGITGRANLERQKSTLRGPSRSSTALDPEPTAQADPLRTLISTPAMVGSTGKRTSAPDFYSKSPP